MIYYESGSEADWDGQEDSMEAHSSHFPGVSLVSKVSFRTCGAKTSSTVLPSTSNDNRDLSTYFAFAYRERKHRCCPAEDVPG